MGNGRQLRSYMHVADCVEAMIHVGLTVKARPPEPDGEVWTLKPIFPYVGIFNVSNQHPWTVVQSIECLIRELKLSPEVIYGPEPRGWVGDSPHIEPDTTRLLATGWRPQFTTEEAVVQTIHDLKHRQQMGEFSR